MKTHDHDDLVLEQQLQEHYEQRYGQPPAPAALWGRLAPHLEARAQPTTSRSRWGQLLRPARDAHMQRAAQPSSGFQGPSRLGKIAALIALCVLVGSMLIVFRLATQKAQTTTGKGAQGGISALYLWTVHDTHGEGIDSITLTRIEKATQKRVWQRTIQWTVNIPSIVGDSAYGITNNTNNGEQRVYALNLRDGSIRWNVVVGQGDFLTDPAVWNGSVYVWYWKGLLYSLDSATGKTNWVYDSKLVARDGTSPGFVAVANGIVYNTVLNTLVAVDAKAGTLLWSKTIDSNLRFSFLAPTVAGDTLYITALTGSQFSSPGPGFVYALDARSGVQKWTYKFNKPGLGYVLVAGNRAFFFDNGVSALDAKTGKLIWSQYPQCIPGSVDGGSVDEVLEAVCADGSKNSDTFLLRVLDPATGKTLWSRASVHSSHYRDGVIYAVVASQVVALQAHDGRELWHIQIKGYDSFGLWYVS